MDVFWIEPQIGQLSKVFRMEPGKGNGVDTESGHSFMIQSPSMEGGAKVTATGLSAIADFNCKVKGSQVVCNAGGASAETQDLYEALEVDEDADDGAIKKAYRRLSVMYHPDKNPDEAKRFNTIRDAYEILSNPETRVLYDTGGMEILKKAKKEEVPTTDDIEQTMEFTLVDAYTGVVLAVEYNRRIVCRGCGANPQKPSCKGCSRCPSTFEMRHRRQGNMIFQEQFEKKSTEDCKVEKKRLDVHIEKGTFPSDQVEFKYMASQMPGHKPGHFVVKLKQHVDKRFTRIGKDLMVHVNVTLHESLLGFERQIVHLDGHTVHVQTDDVTKPGQVLLVRGEGMPDKDVPSQLGDLRLQVNVVFPSRLSPYDQARLTKVAGLHLAGTTKSSGEGQTAGARSEL